MATGYRDSDKTRTGFAVGHCDGCGAEMRKSALTCRECGTVAPTHRCAHCYHRNERGARQCDACGDALGLEPVAEASTTPCPVCNVTFARVPIRDGALLDCGICGAQFVDHALFAGLVLEKQQAQRIDGRPLQANPLVRPVAYVKCPICAQLMHRRNYGKTSGVIVDICHEHGIWFDRGELPLVLRFVEQGGLTRAAALAAREEADRRRQERVELARRRSAPRSRPYTRVGANLELNEALFSALADALFGR